MTHLLLLATLAAGSGQHIAVMPFRAVDVTEGKGALVSEHIATRLIEQGVRVSTPRDVAAVLGLERQKQLLGCGGDGSCVAEIAGALGVTELLNGELARVDDGYRLLVKVISAKDARPQFVRSVSLKSEREVFEALDAWAFAIAGKEAPRAARSLMPVVPMAIGGAAMVVGAGFLTSAAVSWGALQQRADAALSYADAQTARVNGERDQVLGIALAGGGAVALAAGVVWFAATTPKEPVVWVAPSFNGVMLGGTW
jgi:hypothetical protein